MQFSFSYDKKKVIQGLRYHFISRTEIRVLIILVNVFAIISAVLFYLKKIGPEPFLLSSVLWLLLMISFWFVLPASIYKRAHTFKESFTIFFYEKHVRLENIRGYVDWDWSQFSTFFESPNFFHLYFNPKSFFLIPKDNMDSDIIHTLRVLFNTKIRSKKS
ncbi:MAG: YcxB family protein [Chitinophagaceae bacterium]